MNDHRSRTVSAARKLLIPLLAIFLAVVSSLTSAAPSASATRATANQPPARVNGIRLLTTGRPAPTAPPQHVPATAVPRPGRKTEPPSSVRDVITISTGDTLSGLAIRYGTTVRTLQALNGMGRSTLIYAGAVLRVPAHGHRHVGRVSRTPAGTAIAFARAQLSKPYVWGGTGPVGFDCSGLVMRAWQAAGVTLPRTTYDQVNAGTRITRGQLLPGDLVFTNNDGHVQLYIGSGRVIQAPHTGAVVRVSPLAPGTQVDAYVRVRS